MSVLKNNKKEISKSVKNVSEIVQSLQGSGYTSSHALIVCGIPKRKGKSDDEIEFAIGATGHPEMVAKTMIKKAKSDMMFAEFCQEFVKKLTACLVEEKIEEKLQTARFKAEQIINQEKERINNKN